MTNIIEIIDKLNKEGYHIDVAIVDGRLYVIYKNRPYDITRVSFSRAVMLISDFMNDELKDQIIELR